MKLYFDGSCGPKNPGGYACYAFVVIDEKKEIFRKTGVECQGEDATNNIAEYAGLLHGLEYMIENNITQKVEIFGDSQLVINQVNGTWKCKQKHLQTVLANVHSKLDQFTSWEANWIPRENNALADGLSKWDSVVNG